MTKKQQVYVTAMETLRGLDEAAEVVRARASTALDASRNASRLLQETERGVSAAKRRANDHHNNIAKDLTRRLRSRLHNRGVRCTVTPVLHYTEMACKAGSKIEIHVGIGPVVEEARYRLPDGHQTQLIFRVLPTGDLVAFLDKTVSTIVAAIEVVEPQPEEAS